MSIVSFEDLAQATGKKTPAAVAVSLKNSGIRYFCGKGGRPWTTVEAINAALGLAKPATANNKPKIEIE